MRKSRLGKRVITVVDSCWLGGVTGGHLSGVPLKNGIFFTFADNQISQAPSDLSQAQEKQRPKKSQNPKAKQLPKSKNRNKDKNMTQIVTPPTVCVLCFFDVSFLIFPFCLAFGFWILAFLKNLQNLTLTPSPNTGDYWKIGWRGGRLFV
jgi:hypothetical protein